MFGRTSMKKEPLGMWTRDAMFAISAIVMGIAASLGCSRHSAPPTPQQLLAQLTDKAVSGDGSAQLELGSKLYSGIEAPMDIDGALEWWTKAATQGNTAAQMELAKHYANNSYNRDNMGKAVRWLGEAARSGDVTAQRWENYVDGMRAVFGAGVPKDSKRGWELIADAAAGGYSEAQSTIGASYLLGDDRPRDVARGLEYLTKAADQGNATAHVLLGLGYYFPERAKNIVKRDRAKGLSHLIAAAAQGHPEAQRELARAYCSDAGDLTKDEALSYEDGLRMCDPVLALAWASVAIAQGNAKAESLRRDAEVVLKYSRAFAGIEEAKALAAAWKPGMILKRRGRRARGAGSGPLGRTATGTGFYVSETGHVITNHHVIDGCAEVRFQGDATRVAVVTSDKANDLALLKASAVSSATSLSPSTQVQQGEEVVVFGFPLNSILSSGGNVTPGVVSALSGFQNNTSQIQVTAPIQPGSSGSAVLDRKGHLIGVILSSLTGGSGSESTSVPQNVNFAVNSQILRAFMDTNAVPYETGSRFFDRSRSNEEIAESAKTWSVIVECWE